MSGQNSCLAADQKFQDTLLVQLVVNLHEMVSMEIFSLSFSIYRAFRFYGRFVLYSAFLLSNDRNYCGRLSYLAKYDWNKLFELDSLDPVKLVMNGAHRTKIYLCVKVARIHSYLLHTFHMYGKN